MWRVGVLLVRVVLGALLVAASLSFLVAALLRREVQNGLVAIGLLLGVLWFLWSMLPNWFRSAIHWALKRKDHRDGR